MKKRIIKQRFFLLTVAFKSQTALKLSFPLVVFFSFSTEKMLVSPSSLMDIPLFNATYPQLSTFFFFLFFRRILLETIEISVWPAPIPPEEELVVVEVFFFFLFVFPRGKAHSWGEREHRLVRARAAVLIRRWLCRDCVACITWIYIIRALELVFFQRLYYYIKWDATHVRQNNYWY